MTLVPSCIRFIRIFAGVPWRGGVKQQWGYRQQQFSVFSLVVSLTTFEIRSALWHRDTESLVGFLLISKHVTLSDLEWTFYVKFTYGRKTDFNAKWPYKGIQGHVLWGQWKGDKELSNILCNNVGLIC